MAASSTVMTDHDREERDNFFRLTLLLFRLGNTKLREYLKSEWPGVYLKANPGSAPTPWSDTPADASALKNIGKLRFQFKKQENKFNSGNTNDWDFSLLSLVLLSAPLGFTATPSPENDALKEIKEIRNTVICHAKDARIENAVFEAEWNTACKALKKFNATQGELDAIEEDVKQPLYILLPVLKEFVKLEEEILASLVDLETKSEARHKELMETNAVHKDEVISTIKEEGLATRKAIEESSQPKTPENRHLKMVEDQRLLLEQRLPYFEDDVIATDLLHNLPCLTDEQKDQIAYDERNYLPSKAVRTLVEKLEEHEEGFHQFVQVLRKADLGHVAVILDPDSKIHVAEDDEDIHYVSIDGTATDIHISVRIWNALTVRQIKLEERAVLQFGKSHSLASKQLRKYFEQKLPQGVYFVHTTQLGRKGKKDSVVFVFRVAKANALVDLWNMYVDNVIKTMLTDVLAKRVLNDADAKLTSEALFQEKDYEESLEKLKGPDSVKDSELSTEGNLDVSNDLDATHRDKAEGKLRISRVYLGDDAQKELTLRDYQNELAAPALEGKNTIICAPTNSGKTFVAMEIAKRHLDSYKDSRGEATSDARTPKVIFAVKKQNLVLQQRVRFEQYLTNYSISDISGSSSDGTPLHSLMQNNDVVVLTAQILVNAMKRKSVSISDISLLVFDECHHANGEEPYNMIMQVYLKEKNNEDNKGNLPQIVGLTASLGVGKSDTQDKAKEHILQMCANLDASNISTVRDKIQELETNVTGSLPDRNIITVNNDTPNIFESEINKAMEQIEVFIIETGTCDPPSTTDRQRTSYRQWIENLLKDASLQKYRDNFLRGEHLRSYHEALLINNVVRIEDAMTYLETFYAKLDQSKFNETGSWLQDLYRTTKERIEKHEQKATENPLLETLKGKIIEIHEKQKKSEAKGMLFVERRDYTVALERWIGETKILNDILRPDILVGSGDSEIGLTQSQQENIIKKFKSGDINIIIATTVAEEGLDISDCCYVIRYGVKTNEISSVQSRGRIRADEGNYVYIGDSRSKGANQELRNETREKMMSYAVEKVRDMDQVKFSNEVKQFQLQSILKFQAKEQSEASKPAVQDLAGGATFYCKSCNELACHSHDMRLYETYRVVIQPDIYKRSNIKPHEKPKQIDEVLVHEKIHCKKCDFDWGVVITVAGKDWPCLKICSFVTEFKEKRRAYKKWKEVPFTLPPLN